MRPPEQPVVKTHAWMEQRVDGLDQTVNRLWMRLLMVAVLLSINAIILVIHMVLHY